MSNLDQLAALCGDDQDATALIAGVWNLCEVWDDAIDGEKNESDDDIHRAFEFALFDLHANGFYQRHRATLEPVMRLMIDNWKCANDLERMGTPGALVHAYALRCSPYDFFYTVVLLASGPHAAVRAAQLLRCQQMDVDSIPAYFAEHRKAG